MEDTTANEDVLLVQTEGGEQIALPVSALASDFEVIVESTDNNNSTVNKRRRRKEPLQIRPLEEVEFTLEIIEEPEKIERKQRKEKVRKSVEKPVKIEPEIEIEPQQQPQHRQHDQQQLTPTRRPPRSRPQPTPPQTERRTRLSNTCRVATGRSYKCKDCDFSTDRINNIISHMKENCSRRSRYT